MKKVYLVSYNSSYFPVKLVWDSGNQSSVFASKESAIKYAKSRFSLDVEIIDRIGGEKTC